MTAVSSTELREWLFGLTLHGIKLGLDNIQHLMEEAGRPEQRYPTVHVAGTNGKGSVVAILDAMLRAAGYRTGRFTSPHLIDLSERFLVDGRPIAEDLLDDQILFFKTVAGAMDPPPTFFELCTAIAFRAFEHAHVDVALIEVGMGGRFDSTNIVQPETSAITNIYLEHTEHLGDTLEKIAFEKAGVLKAGTPAVVGVTDPGARRVILEQAQRVGSPVRLYGREYTFQVEGDPWRQKFTYAGPDLAIANVPLALAGRHQAPNAAVATALGELLRPGFPALDVEAFTTGLAQARWPCRLERVRTDPPVIVDVAHNVAGAERTASLFDECVVVLAVSSDKDAPGIVRALAPAAARFILTEFEGKRALPLARLTEAAAGYPADTCPSVPEAIATGLRLASPERPLLITGSIYTAGEARRCLVECHGAPPLHF